MIGSAIQYGDMLVLRDGFGNTISNLSLNGGEFVGHSSTYVMIRYQNMIVTYDEDGNQLGNYTLPSDFRIQGITDNGFYARTGSILEQFDPYCNYVGPVSV